MTKELTKLLLKDIRQNKSISTTYIRAIMEQKIEPVEVMYISHIDGKLTYTVKFEQELKLYRGLVV